MDNEPQADMEPHIIDDDALVRIAVFLEGFKLGRGGHIRPLGNINLEELRNAVQYLRGSNMYKARRDLKPKDRN